MTCKTCDGLTFVVCHCNGDNMCCCLNTGAADCPDCFTGLKKIPKHPITWVMLTAAAFVAALTFGFWILVSMSRYLKHSIL